MIFSPMCGTSAGWHDHKKLLQKGNHSRSKILSRKHYENGYEERGYLKSQEG